MTDATGEVPGVGQRVRDCRSHAGGVVTALAGRYVMVRYDTGVEVYRLAHLVEAA